MKNEPCYTCWAPPEMLKEPHLVHYGGILMQPGRQNDYTIEFSELEHDAFLHWWDPTVCEHEEKLISITSLSTGDRWAFSSVGGVYVDTRRKKL